MPDPYIFPEDPVTGDRITTPHGIVYEFTEGEGWLAIDRPLLKNKLLEKGVVFVDDEQTLTRKTLESPIINLPTFTAVTEEGIQPILDYILENTDIVVDVPGKPRNVEIDQRTKLDQDGRLDLRFKVSWDAPLGFEDDDRISYEVRVEDEEDVTNKPSKDTKIWFEVRSGVSYKIKVRSISAGGKPSDWSPEYTVIANKKATKPVAPTSLQANGGNHRVKLKWNPSTEKDYKATNIYYGTINDFEDIVFDPVTVSGTEAIIDDLYANTNYYFWITFVDRSGNESNKFPASNTGGRLGTTKIANADDPTPPGLPQDLEVVQRTRIDLDGNLGNFGIASWDAPIGAAIGVSYEITVREEGGDTITLSTKGRTIRFEVTSGETYWVAVRAINGVGIPGDWTDEKFLIAHKKMGEPNAPTGLTAKGQHNRATLKWDESIDKDYKRTKIYVSTVNDFSLGVEVAGSISGTRFIDDDLEQNTNYYYWITHFDKSGNESAKHPASNTNGRLATTKEDVSGDDMTEPGVPQNVELSISSNLNEQGDIQLYCNVEWDAPIGSATSVMYEVQVLRPSGKTFNLTSKDRSVRFAVRALVFPEAYSVRVRTISRNNVEGDWTGWFAITPDPKMALPDAPIDLFSNGGQKRVKLWWTPSEEADYKITRVYRATVNDFALASVAGRSVGTPYIDDQLINNETYYYWISFVDKTGNVSPKFPTDSDNGLAVTTSKLKDEDTDDDPPGQPHTVELTLRSYLDDDGKMYLKLIVKWQAHPGKTNKDTYEIYVRDDDDNYRYYSKDEVIRFDVKANTRYYVKVRAIKFNGLNGPWSAEQDLYINKKNTQPYVPEALMTTGGSRRIRVKVPKSSDPNFKDYAETVIYRSETVNNFINADEVGRTKGTVFIDDDLHPNTDYFYWATFVDRSRNEGAKFPTSNTAGIIGTTKALVDEDTDDAAPGQISDLHLNQKTHVAQDGKVSIYVIATWLQQAGYKEKDTFEVDVYNGEDHERIMVKNAFCKFRARAEVLYTVKVRAIKFNGKAGEWNEIPEDITPVKKLDPSTTPSGFSIAGGQKRNKLKWTACPDNDYKHTKIYRTQGLTWPGEPGHAEFPGVLDKVDGSVFIDDNLNGGVGYRYYISHIDFSGNESVVFPSTLGAGLIGIPGETTTPEISPGTITDELTDQTPVAIPDNLEVAQAAIDVDGDGTVDIAISADWDPVVGAKTYSVRIKQGSRPYRYVVCDEPGYEFKAKVGVTYKVSVRSLSFNGSKSAYTGEITCEPEKKMVPPPDPESLAVDGGVKRTRLRWSKSTAKDYKLSRVYRSMTTSFPGKGNHLDEVKGSYYLDDDLETGTTYRYYVTHVDRSGNESEAFPADTGAGIPGIPGRITKDVLNTDPEAVPTGLFVEQVYVTGTSVDVDDSGVPYIALKATWDAVTDATGYTLQITQGSEVTYHTLDDTVYIWRVKSNKLYSIKVRSLSAFNIKSALSSAFTITPSKKIDVPTTAAGLTVAGGVKRNKLSWTQCPDKDYKHTIIYRSLDTSWPDDAGIVGRTQSTTFIHDDLEPDTSYRYYIAHVDTSGNRGIVFPSTVGAGVLGVPGAITTPEISPGTITDNLTDQTPAAIPENLELDQLSYDMDDDGVVDKVLKVTWDAVSGAKAYSVRIKQGTKTTFTMVDTNELLVKVLAPKLYEVAVRSFSFNGSKSNFTGDAEYTTSGKLVPPSNPTSLTIAGGTKRNKLKWSKSTAKDYKHTRIYRAVTTSWPGEDGYIDNIKGSTFIDDDLTPETSYYYYVRHEDTSGNMSEPFPADTGSGLIGIPGQVTATIDDTPPNVPTVSMTGYGDDFDKDGTIDSGLRITTTYPNSGGVPQGMEIGSYVLRVQRSDTQVGGYTDWNKFTVAAEDTEGDEASLTTVYQTKANSKKWFRVQARSVAAVSGKKSGWSSWTSGVKPSVNTGYNGQATSSPAVEAIANGYRVTWTLSGLDEDKYKETEIFVNGASVAKITGLTYIDTEARAIGDEPLFNIRHYDKGGNYSTTSSPAVTAPKFRGVNDEELGVGRGSNLLINTNANLGTLYWKEETDTNSVTTLDLLTRGNANAPTGEQCMVVSQANGTTGGYSVIVHTDELGNNRKIPVLANQRYEFHLLIRSLRANSYGYISWYTSADAFISDSAMVQYTGSLGSGNVLAGYKQHGIFALAPATAAYAIIRIRKNNTTSGASPASSYLYFTHMFFSEAMEGQEAFSPWSENGNLITTDATTDQRVPDSPTAVTLGDGLLTVAPDGTVEANTTVSWTAPVAGVPVTEYSVLITQDTGQTTTVVTSDTSVSVPVRTGVEYGFQVASIAFNNKASAYTTKINKTRAKKPSGGVPDVGTVTTATNKKRIKLDWVDVDDDAYPDYRNTWIYRNTSGTAPTMGTTPYKKTKAGYYIDDDVVSGTGYYYWLIHKDNSGNYGTSSGRIGPLTSGGNEVSSFTDLTGQINVTTQIANNAIIEAKVDNTPPDAVTVVFEGYGADFDEDGTIDAGLQATITNPGTGTRIVGYVLRITRSNTSGGTYSPWRTERIEAEDFGDSNTTFFAIQANKKKWYKLQVRAVGYNGRKGPWTTLSSAVQPSTYAGYAGATIPNPSGTPNGEPIANGYRYTWTLTLDSALYKETQVWIDGSVIATVSGTSYVDMTPRSIGSTYSLTIKHVDKQDGISNASTAKTLAAFRATDIADITQDTPSTPGSAPTLQNLTPKVQGDGSLDLGFYMNLPSAPSNTQYWEVEVWTNTAVGTNGSISGYSKADSIMVKAEQGGVTYVSFSANSTLYHKVRYRGIGWSGLAGTPSAYTTTGVLPSNYNSFTGVTPSQPNVVPMPNGFKISWSIPTDRTYAYTAVYVGGTLAGTSAGGYLVDTTPRTLGSTYQVYIKHFDSQGNSTNNGTEATSPQYRATNTSEVGVGTINNDSTVTSAPANPGSVTVGQAPLDIDNGDGSVTVMGLVTWNAPSPGTNPAKTYSVSVYDGTNYTYPLVQDTSCKFSAIVGKTYTIVTKSIGFNGQSSSGVTTSGWQPLAKTAVPPALTFSSITSLPNALRIAWVKPSNTDYLRTEIGWHTTASASPIGYLGDATGTNVRIPLFPTYDGDIYIFIRQVNTSGVASAWTRYSTPTGATKLQTEDIYNNSITRGKLVAGAAGAIAETNTGTSGGSVNPGTGWTSTLLNWTFKCTSNTTGVTVTLGSNSWTVDFKDQVPFSFSSRESGGGSFSASKSGGGTFAGGKLEAIGIY